MKNNKMIFVIIGIAIAIVIILVIFLLIVSTQCSKQESLTTEQETITKEIQEETTSKESKEEVTEEEEAVATEEEAATEEEVTEEKEEAEEEKEAPTISLSIYEGPTYSPSDNLCYYRIKATVTGNPGPTVEWNKDDSGGTWGTKKAQVNLHDPDETYTLIATATNSEGTDTASIELSWGCEVENQDPVISEITLMGTKYTNIEYTISTAASDPDGDSLTYKWVITNPRGDPNGTISNDSASVMKWTTPPTPGEYRIEVSVDDGKGGEANAYEIVDVHFFYDLLAKAPSANWSNGTGDNHLWNAGLDDIRGFACYRNNITLEDDITYTKVLETHPQWINNGVIGGEYLDIIKIPGGARFTASIGFLKDATGTGGVGFVVWFRDTSSVDHQITNGVATYNGALDSLNIDLSSLAGKSGKIILEIYAGASSGQDWAVWVDPQITN